MRKVIHIDNQVGGGSGTGYIGVFANYTALTTAYPTAPTLSLAYLQNSQGTAWLPGGLGGTFYSKGTYLFDGVNWVDGLDEVSEELQELIDNQYLIKVSTSDTTPNYLINKNEDTIDTFRLFINPGGDEKVGFNLFAYNKVWVTGPEPNSGNDDSIPKRHRIGQIWCATSTGNFFIAKSLLTGAAVWEKIQIDNGKIIFNNVVQPLPLVANTDNWTIPSLETYNVIKAQTSGANYNVTGIDSTNVVDGQTFFFYNVGLSGNIKFKKNNAGSLPQNRIILNGDITIKTGMGVVLTYDTTASRWRVNYFK